MIDEELQIRLERFISCVELVFDIDWDYTKLSIIDEDFIAGNGTFLNPFPGEHYTGGKGDNWGNRSSFLAAYRELKALAISEGLYNPDEDPWND